MSPVVQMVNWALVLALFRAALGDDYFVFMDKGHNLVVVDYEDDDVGLGKRKFYQAVYVPSRVLSGIVNGGRSEAELQELLEAFREA